LTGRIIGVEALVRWQHPKRGEVSPREFIPLAEETGLIFPIGKWVLEAACKQSADWTARFPDSSIFVAVNVSARQFDQDIFVSEVNSALAHSGCNPTLLKLELTESVLLKNIEAHIEKMADLTKLGVRFSLDDFGTGYSSLSYLKRLPLNQLKIDISFVRDILTDSNDATITRAIIALGHNLGLQVIAEGVELDGQRAFLEANGCDAYQGYLFGRPMLANDFEKLLSEHFPARAPSGPRFQFRQ
jgi:EAL domain-containing protein (putative c-di-GMP-specific phosphodiesterase class I)